MPYKKFIKTVQGKKKYGLQNIKTGKVALFSSKEKRETGIRMKEAFAHGWIPTKKNNKEVHKNGKTILL